jgi:hypothetical protein
MAMVPSGEFSFRLQLLTKDSADYSLAGPVSAAYFSPKVSPAALLNKRKRNLGNEIGRGTDRRRIARLKSDERPTTAASH